MSTFAQQATGPDTGGLPVCPYASDLDGSIAQPEYSLDYNAYGSQQLLTTLQGPPYYELHQSSNQWEPIEPGLYNN